MNDASARPFRKIKKHCSSIPKVAIYLLSCVAIIEDINFVAMSPNAISLHYLFGLHKSPVFRRINRLNLVKASRLYCGSFQYFRIVLLNSRIP